MPSSGHRDPSSYGKRSTPDQSPPRKGDFDHLPARAAYLASLLDRLPENAAMDGKTIAKAQPLYGQAAVRSTLNELGAAGHLRRVRQKVSPGEGASGTRWTSFPKGDATLETPTSTQGVCAPVSASAPDAQVPDAQKTPEADEDPDAADPVPPRTSNSPRPEQSSGTSTAYDTLARLGLQEHRLALSAADCAALEQLAADWLTRGVTPEYLTHALVSGLPDPVHSPRALVRRRLIDKMPPERTAVPAPPAPRRTLLMECTDCRVPGRPEALPGGLCRGCRSRGDQGGPGAPAQSVRRPGPTGRALAAEVRAGMRVPQRVQRVDLACILEVADLAAERTRKGPPEIVRQTFSLPKPP